MNRYEQLTWHLSLEWLYRLCQEPRRLFKRYLMTNTLFVVLMVREMVRGRRQF